jgi:hypothetical protein
VEEAEWGPDSVPYWASAPLLGLARHSAPDVQQQMDLALETAAYQNPDLGTEANCQSINEVGQTPVREQMTPGNQSPPRSAGGVNICCKPGRRSKECMDQGSVGPGALEVSWTKSWVLLGMGNPWTNNHNSSDIKRSLGAQIIRGGMTCNMDM